MAITVKQLSPIVLGVTLISTTAFMSAALAQDGEQDQQRESARVIEEITVTARKREESLMDVPVVMSVLTEQVLEQDKIDDLYGVASRVPSLLLGAGVNSTGTLVSLRGVGTTVLNGTMDQSVSLNIDGVSLSQGTAYNMGMFDVNVIEVLKGPQSLFFGKNNTGGVVSLRSNDPGDEFEGKVRAGYEFEASEMQGELILSGPVGDTLKLRLAARYSDSDGWYKNDPDPTPGYGSRKPTTTGYAPSKELLLRGTAIWEPTENFSARFKYNLSDFEMQGGTSVLEVVYCPDGTGPVIPFTGIDFLSDDCSLDGTLRLPWPDPASGAWPAGLPNGGVPFEDNEQALSSLELNWNLNDTVALTSVTGYYDADYHVMHNGSTTGNLVPFMNVIDFTNEQFTQELRLTTDNPDSALNWMFGAFYQDASMTNEVDVPVNLAMGIPLPPTLLHVKHYVDTRTFALFGQGIWDISDQLELAFGARWTDEERKHKLYNFWPGTAPVGWVDRLDPKLNPSDVSPEVTLTWRPSDTMTAFASYKSGFKSGSFTSQTYVPPTVPASFDDEEASGFEGGLRSIWLDGSLSTNIAAYYYDYDNLQVGALELTELPGGNWVFAVRTLNAAKSNVRGIDFDFTYAPPGLDGLTISGALNYNRARYDSFVNAPCGNGQTIAQGCNSIQNPDTGQYLSQDLSGRRLVKAPEWAGFLGFQHQSFVGDAMALSWGASGNFTSEYSTTLVDMPGFEQGSFFKYDANVSLRSREETWEAAIIGRNLGNELTRGWCVNSNIANGTIFGQQQYGYETSGPAGNAEAMCYVERGREIWAQLSWFF